MKKNELPAELPASFWRQTINLEVAVKELCPGELEENKHLYKNAKQLLFCRWGDAVVKKEQMSHHQLLL